MILAVGFALYVIAFLINIGLYALDLKCKQIAKKGKRKAVKPSYIPHGKGFYKKAKRVTNIGKH